ncbi:MAG: twin transmembrane helix small protein [Proteobacteria bacterium]|nr:twin transmembrane helix small protein [Pseudomonadota bacterium]HQR03902.1 twin transmembrane helix small protein [Rhodocyclaceae bacterium]
MRILVILFLFFILYSLGSALYFLLRNKGRDPRTVKALTVRIVLSIGLFLLLIISRRLGFIHGHL